MSNPTTLVPMLAAVLSIAMPSFARAEVVQSSPAAIVLEHRYPIAATPQQAWRALVHPELWWPSDHTWSGAATNLRLEAQAGGCFCENWGEASAEHGRVVMSRPGELLRIQGALGPLQAMAVSAVLTIELEAAPGGGTNAKVTYRVSGDPTHGLDKFAPAVDQVVGLQFGNFARYAASAPATTSP
jgi:uncharacterized protein YndB with AHSA1/START domain